MKTPFKSLGAGALAPHSTVVVRFQTPLDLEVDFPAVITVSGRGAVSVLKTESTQITIQNNTAKHAPYWLVVVPRRVVLAASTDWRALFQKLKQRLLQGTP